MWRIQKKEIVFKKTERGDELFKEMIKLQNKYEKENPREYGRAPRAVEEWIANLSDEDFYTMMEEPIGNYSRVHYTMMRNRKRKELMLDNESSLHNE